MGIPSSSKQSLTVTDNRTGKVYEIPITQNTIKATDVKQIKASRHSVFGSIDREEHLTSEGLRVHDPGFNNTTVITSTITHIDGAAGILRYRGYSIEELAQKSNFLEVSYLLIYGELPTVAQYSQWEQEVLHHSFVHSDVEDLVRSFRYDSHPMGILASSFMALGTFAPEGNPSLQGQALYTKGAKGDVKSLATLDKQIVRLVGKAPTLAALAYRMRQGRPFNRPPNGLSYTGTFLYLLDALNEREYRPNPVIEKALDVLFILHADHELNASTATALQVGSTLVDPYSAVGAATAALYGPLHGGACEAVIRMLTEIGTVDKVPEFLKLVKEKKRVLSGFGHRVYKTTDPRSTIVRNLAEDVFKVTGRTSNRLEIAEALREAALKDEYFTSRHLYPNVDFYTSSIYEAIGVPVDMMVILFCVPRVVGWLSHLRQQWLQPSGVKIWRPRQIYDGSGLREYTPFSERSEPSSDVPVQNAPVPIPHTGATRRAQLGTYKDELGRIHVGGKL